jgi:hypothetical protein
LTTGTISRHYTLMTTRRLPTTLAAIGLASLSIFWACQPAHAGFKVPRTVHESSDLAAATEAAAKKGSAVSFLYTDPEST